MSIRLTIAKGGFAAAALAMTLAGALAAPQVASAQDQPYQSYQDCKQDQTNRAIAGGVLGAIGGAVIGSNVAHGGGRDGGALLGGAVGAAGGAAIAHSTKNCDGYYDAGGPPPPPPPPPPGYYDNGPPPGYGQGYDNGYRGDYDGRYLRCSMVETRTFFPDGSTQRDEVRACRASDGHWYVAP
jgi:surface antigen